MALGRLRAGHLPEGLAISSTARCVVLAVRNHDEEGNIFGAGIEVTVVVTDGARMRRIEGVPVVQFGAGSGNDSVWVPNPTTRNMDTGDNVSVETFDDPDAVLPPLDALDGDHGLLIYIGNSLDDPLLAFSLPHPRQEQRLRMVEMDEIPEDAAHPARPDGRVRYTRHQGTVVMVDRLGNVVIDTTGAGVENSGDEVTESGPKGRVVINISEDEQVEIRGNGTTRMLVTADGDIMLGAEDATEAAVLGDKLSTYLTTTLSVSTAMGPSGPAATGLSDELSDKVKIK